MTVKKAAPAVEPPKKDEQITAEPPPKAPSLFDTPAPVSVQPTPPADSYEEAEILAEIKESEESEEEKEARVGQ